MRSVLTAYNTAIAKTACGCHRVHACDTPEAAALARVVRIASNPVACSVGPRVLVASKISRGPSTNYRPNTKRLTVVHVRRADVIESLYADDVDKTVDDCQVGKLVEKHEWRTCS